MRSISKERRSNHVRRHANGDGSLEIILREARLNTNCVLFWIKAEQIRILQVQRNKRFQIPCNCGSMRNLNSLIPSWSTRSANWNDLLMRSYLMISTSLQIQFIVLWYRRLSITPQVVCFVWNPILIRVWLSLRPSDGWLPDANFVLLILFVSYMHF